MCSPMKCFVVNPKREWHVGQSHNNGDEILYWKNTASDVVLCEACVCKRYAPKCVRIRLWPVRRGDSSRVLIGAAGMWRSDWPDRVQALGLARAASIAYYNMAFGVHVEPEKDLC